MAEQLSKRVTLIEAFYDLVFVYMISRATALIHQLTDGVVKPTTFLIFTFVVIVFINSWMVQTVFTNRYGSSSWSDMFYAFVDMAIVLYMSNSFSGSLTYDLHPFFIAAGLLSATLLAQYLGVRLKTAARIDQQIATVFIYILLIRTCTLLIAGFIPEPIGIPLALVGIISSWIAPSFTGKYTKHHPIIFSHLVERLSLLTIIMFGETIVAIAGYFTKQTLSIGSVMVFAVVVALFFTYIAEFDHLINNQRRGETGNLLIYLHYPIIFGLSLITVALNFVGELDHNFDFPVTMLYLGLFLFYTGISLATRFNRQPFGHGSFTRVIFILSWIVAFAAALMAENFYTIVTITLVDTLLISYLMFQEVKLHV